MNKATEKAIQAGAEDAIKALRMRPLNIDAKIIGDSSTLHMLRVYLLYKLDRYKIYHAYIDKGELAGSSESVREHVAAAVFRCIRKQTQVA